MENKEEEIRTIYQRLKPSEETLRRLSEGEKRFNHLDDSMNKVTIEIATMKKDIQQINEKLDCHTKKFDQLGEKIDKFLEGCDRKYAGKYVENWINWALKIIVGAVLLALLGLVIIKNV